MRKVVFILLTCWIAGQALAADAPWLTSVPDALVQAKKENKLVLLNFTGSDWCIACKVIDTEIFSKPEFTNYAKTNLVLVELDFPLNKKQPDALVKANEALQTKYNIDGYPTLLLLKPDETAVWTNTGLFPGGATAMIAKFEEVKKKYLP
jgi:thiol:disulfide interchange protein